MRTAGKQKAGFYPTPLGVVEQIASFIDRPTFGDRHRIIDPCCGRGDALRVLSSRLGIKETYGVELDKERAKESEKFLKRVLTGSYESLRSVWNGFSVLFLNPPYDHDEESKRLEYRFLTKLTAYLQDSGVLIYIIAQKHLNKKTARYLASHYENIEVRRFPDPDYEAFGQIVIFGERTKYVNEDREVREKLEKISLLPKEEIRALETLEYPLYYLSSNPVEHFEFYLEDFDLDDALLEIQTNGLLKKGAVADKVYLNELPRVRPLMSLRKGHLSMLIAAGYLNNVALEYKGREILIKGCCVKEQAEKTESTEDGKKVYVRDVIKTSIKGLDLLSGELITIE